MSDFRPCNIISFISYLFETNDTISGQTPALRQAAIDGNLQGVEKALKHNAAIDYQIYPYHGRVALVEKGANPYLPYRGLYNTPLEAARANNCQDIVKYLHVVMRLPETLNKTDHLGYTLLGRFLRLKCNKRAIELIELGADVCKTDRHGKTPHVYAVEKTSTEIVEKLLEKGAGASCLSVLKLARKLALTTNSDEMTQLLKLLIKSQPEVVNAHLDDGFTPLTKTLRNYNLEMAEYLIENGAYSKQDRNGNLPLDQALEMNSIEIAEMLLFKNPQEVQFPLKVNPKLVTKLAENNTLDVYRFLVENNWNLEQRDENGKTSLALSAAHQHLLLTEFFFIENGADISRAEAEIEAFRSYNCDFDLFMESYLVSKNEVAYKWDLTGTKH